MKLSSKVWLLLLLGMPLLSPAQKCTVSHQDQNLVENLSKSHLKFSFDTYKSLANKENLFFSPFSISVALAMTSAGAGGNTLTQMKAVLNLNNFTDEKQINQAFSSVLNSICSNSNYALSTANKIFVQNNFPILQPFLNTLTSSYQSTPENVDFRANADGVASQINSWVEKQTNNHIQNLFSPGSLDPSTILVLANAIYFKGTWLNRFDEKDTKPEDFRLTNGKTVSVSMMNIEEQFKYAKSDPLKSKLLQLDYAGDRLVMYIILPDQKDGLARLQQQLTPDSFNSFRKQLSFRKVTVKIPKFKLNFKQQLNEKLAGLGITDLFNAGQANLTRISDPKDGRLYVSTVIHQAFVEVDEKGTTAAAATGIGISFMSAAISPPEIFTFIADHPFIFVIYDTLTNLILFMGNVDNP